MLFDDNSWLTGLTKKSGGANRVNAALSVGGCCIADGRMPDAEVELVNGAESANPGLRIVVGDGIFSV